MTLNRKQLPAFGYLKHIKVDMSSLLNYCTENNLLDFNIYNDIKVSPDHPTTGSSYNNFVIANEYCKESIFKEENAAHMQGEKYKQLYLTEFDSTKKSEKVSLHNTNIFERTKRLNPNNPRYLPEADERNYGKRNSLVQGEIKKVLNLFQHALGRVRFAYLAPGFKIKPHVDYDPSYIVRYHIPILTNKQCVIGVMLKNNVRKIHWPSDGRIYFLNTGNKHWAENNSKLPRIHLIIDVQGQQELEYLKKI